jgi:hypothetical protein
VSDEIIDDAVAAPEVDKPDNDADASGAPEQADEQSSGEESFTDFDPSSIPETGASPQWLKEQYDLMRKGFTQKMQEFGETRRDRDQLNQIVEGIRNGDAETRRSLLPLLGMTKEAFFEAFELEEAQQEAAEAAADQEPQFDEFDPTVVRDPRVDAWEEEKAQQRQREAEAEEAKEAEAEADKVGTRMEEELQSVFGDDLPSERRQKEIFNDAIDNPDPLGNPDMKTAIATYKQELAEEQEKWLASRQGPRAATQGVPGSERFDTSAKEGRDALALEGVRGVNAPR